MSNYNLSTVMTLKIQIIGLHFFKTSFSSSCIFMNFWKTYVYSYQTSKRLNRSGPNLYVAIYINPWTRFMTGGLNVRVWFNKLLICKLFWKCYFWKYESLYEGWKNCRAGIYSVIILAFFNLIKCVHFIAFLINDLQDILY